MDWRLTTTDRGIQMNWLCELSANLISNLGEGTAEEIVEYALSNEGRDCWGITIPAWFDGHDRNLLVKMVADNS